MMLTMEASLLAQPAWRPVWLNTKLSICQAFTYPFEVLLELAIVGQVERADAGGIAAAAQVFQQMA
jgi:hypothetical protein